MKFFGSSQQVERECAWILRASLPNWGHIPHQDDSNFWPRGIDYTLISNTTDKQLFVDDKACQRAMSTGNVAIELAHVQRYGPHRQGWVQTSQSGLIRYYCKNTRALFLLDLYELRAWLARNLFSNSLCKIKGTPNGKGRAAPGASECQFVTLNMVLPLNVVANSNYARCVDIGEVIPELAELPMPRNLRFDKILPYSEVDRWLETLRSFTEPDEGFTNDEIARLAARCSNSEARAAISTLQTSRLVA